MSDDGMKSTVKEAQEHIDFRSDEAAYLSASLIDKENHWILTYKKYQLKNLIHMWSQLIKSGKYSDKDIQMMNRVIGLAKDTLSIKFKRP